MLVKRTISPISLRKIFQTARFADMTRAFTAYELAEFLGMQDSQANRITHETARVGVIEEEAGQFFLTSAGSRFLQMYHKNDSAGLHELLMQHPAYAAFIDLFRSASSVSYDDWNSEQFRTAFPYHAAERRMVCAWAEEVGAVQWNPFTQQYYRIGPLRSSFLPSFLKLYRQLEIPAGPEGTDKPVPVRILREFACQRLRISRYDFDRIIRELCEGQTDVFRLSHPAGSSRMLRWRRCRPSTYSQPGPGSFSHRDSSCFISIDGKQYRFILCKDG